ncbi:MAG: hypothetical protein GX222_03175 [Ruminococcaceae bacterium]|nr:hypothetical protein [Oscillospiraceae bacterium]
MKGRRRKRTVIKTTLLDAEKSEVFFRLQKLKTLQYIAAPYARFIPVDKKQVKWVEGSVFNFRFYLFGFIPLGIHTINVLYSCRDSGICTKEHNAHIPVWDHRIYLESVDGKRTRYTDEVEIEAGWKTPFVALWAKAFYSHRQRKWKKLLSTSD